MLDAFITSTVSLRARESSLPFSANDYSHCTHPFFYSSSRSCCCCCYSSNQLYKVPVSPNYCCNSYGLRQSSLIQCRRFVRSGFNQCYRTRLPVFHSSESCYCDRVCDFREKTVCRRKGGFRRCTVFDEMSEMYDIGGMEEAEVILGLMMEDVEDECFRVKKETRRYLKKPVVVLEKRENYEVNKKFVGKKKIVDAEIEPMYEKNRVGNLRKRDDSRREEIIWRKEQEDKLLKNVALREKEEVDLLLTKPSRKVDVEQEREFILRNDNRQRMEKREDLMRGEDQRDKVRRDGSTCSSYYSFSSGDYENENDTELREEIFLKDLSRSRVRNLRTETVNHNYKENDQKKSIVETDFRKKSEKILNDISVKEMSSNEKTLVKDLNFSNGHESNNGKVSDHYSNYDARKVKLNESGRLDHDSRQSETRLKYKHISQMQDNVVGNSYGSQNSEISGKIASQENVGDRSAVGLYSREGNKYKHNSHKVSDGSKTREIDISRYTSVSHESDISRNTSISQQKIETKDYSTNALVSALVESGDTSLCLTDKTGKSIIKSESDKLIEVEDRLDLAYGSSLESNQSRSHKQAKVIKSVDARNESDEFITHSGNTGGISVDNTNTTPTYLPDTEVLSMAPKVNTPLSEHYSSYGQPSKFISHEDAIGSAARLEKSSSHYVGEFVNQGSEFLSAEIQQEKSHKTKYVQEEQNILIESTTEDPCLEEHGLKHDGKPSGSKIPSDETWKVDGQYRKELPKAVIQENERKSNNAIAKRNGKSLWNMFADVVRLGWSPRSESHGSSRKTVGKSSPNQSTSSETWFSGHDENEGASITNGLSLRHQEEKTQSLVKEGSSSSTSDGYLKSAGINALSSSSSVVVETSGGADSDGNLGVTSSKAAADSAISIPALRLRRFSSMGVGLKPGEEGHTPNSGVSMEHPESVVNVGELKRNKLLRKDHFVKDRFDEWEEAYRVEAEQKKTDEMFMREAILEAKKAAENWEVPVGAVLVHNGKIIARGCNLVEELRDSTAHAEIICIREASNVLRTWRLSETTLYITLEPCPMCAGAILQARIDSVVWGAPNKLLGADGSWIRLFPSGDGGNNGLEQSDKAAAPVHPFHPNIIVRRGVLASECGDAMQQFFKLRRKKEKKPETPTTPPSPTPSSCLPISRHPSKFLSKMHRHI